MRTLDDLIGAVVGRVAMRLEEHFWSSPTASHPSSVTLDAIENFVVQAGIGRGATVLVHSAWENLSSGKFRAADLVKRLLAIVGEQGTLAMPAIPNIPQVSGTLLDVKRTPSAAGLLTETFRRYPGVLRSINLNHSVCAYGPNAEFLTEDHHRSETSWDRHSPYYRLREIDDAWVIGLGVGHRLKVATPLHCVDSALWKENPFFRKLFTHEISYTYETADGRVGEHSYWVRSGRLFTPKLAKHFAKNELIEDTIEGLEAYAIRARLLIDKAISLGRQGKTMYVWPIPFPWYFKQRTGKA